MHRFLRYSPILLSAVAGFAADDGRAIREALAALQRGEFARAEQTLQSEVKVRPNDSSALTLLGVALDSQKKFKEADEIHRRAAALAPNSPDVWNNYGNHMLGRGDAEAARKLYLKVVALAPTHYNANIQLARLALKGKRGGEALGYLKHLPAAQLESPTLAPPHVAALYLAGEVVEADKVSTRWLAASAGDLGLSFSMGLALADAGKFEKAEPFFAQALALAPSDFNVLSSLGVTAWRNGHFERAREVLEAAQRQQPQNVDILYNLACVDHAANRTEAAIGLLAQAARLAPRRSDIQKMLAITTGDVGALDDSAAAWNRYLQLEPGDDVARRERGFTAIQMGRLEQGMADLQWFAARHPDDAVVHFELGAAENKDDPAHALVEFDRALALQADFAAAHSARGSLYYQMGKPEIALADLEAAAVLRPDDAVSLDRLGQTYLALDRAADAVRVLRKAAALAPEDSKTQLHLARALADAGMAAESKAAMDRFRQLGPAVNKAVPGGLVDYLALTPEQRRADYRKRVEQLVLEHPQDAAAQVTWLRVLLEENQLSQAAITAGAIAALKPSAVVLTDAGRSLLDARQYAPARDLLQKAAATAGTPADVTLDLAIATLHATGAAEAMRLLDGVADTARTGYWHLAKAEALDAMGKPLEAAQELEQALRVSPRESGIYIQACAFLLRQGKAEDAMRISGRALEALSGNREVLLLRAVVLQHAKRFDEAGQLLEQVQNRWPEWPAGWLAGGIVLGVRGRQDEARTALATALALGANGALVKRYVDNLPTAAGQAADLTFLFPAQPERTNPSRDR